MVANATEPAVSEKLFALLRRYSRAYAQAASPDQESLALAYMQRAYELGRASGRARKDDARDATDDFNGWRRNEDQGGGDSGPDL